MERRTPRSRLVFIPSSLYDSHSAGFFKHLICPERTNAASNRDGSLVCCTTIDARGEMSFYPRPQCWLIESVCMPHPASSYARLICHTGC